MTSAVRVPRGRIRAFVAILPIIVALSAAETETVSAQSPPAATATMQECRGGEGGGPSFVQQCGDQLRAWSLTLSDIKREVSWDQHGRFYFACPIELMCKDEPLIGGSFVDRAAWLDSARDERAIYERSNALRYPLSPLPPMPPPACAPFEVSIAGIAGRAVCFGESGVKGGSILVVAADDYAAFVLGFSTQDGTVDRLRERVLELLPRFKIERATGDAALLKWFRR